MVKRKGRLFLKNIGIKIVKSASIGTALGTFISAIVLFVLAAVLSIGQLSPVVVGPMALAAQIIGGFVGGFFSGMTAGKKGFLCGLLSGILFFAMIWICGGIFGAANFGWEALIKAAIISAAGVLGGIIGVNR